MRHVLTTIGAVCLALALGACGDDDDSEGAPGATTVDVGLSFNPGVDDAADRVAFEHLAREAGIEASFTQTGGPPNTVAALLHGDVDIGATSLLPAVTAIQQGADIEVILGATMAVDFSLVSREGIDDLANLKGEQVAHGEPGGASEVITKVALERAGFDEGDAKLVVVDDGATRAAALLAGRVAAAALEFPDVKLLSNKEPGLRTLASLYEIAPFLVADVWIVKRSFAERNRELVDRLVRGLLDGYEFVRTPAGRSAWLRQAGSKAEEGERPVLVEVYDRHKETGYWPSAGEPMTAERHDQIVDFWLEAGLLEEPAAFEDVWDVSEWSAASS